MKKAKQKAVNAIRNWLIKVAWSQKISHLYYAIELMPMKDIDHRMPKGTRWNGQTVRIDAKEVETVLFTNTRAHEGPPDSKITAMLTRTRTEGCGRARRAAG